MKRRDFLKLIGIAPIAPSVLAVKTKVLPFKPNDAQKRIITNLNKTTNTITIDRPAKFALGDTCVDVDGQLYIYCNFVCEQPRRSAKLVNVK